MPAAKLAPALRLLLDGGDAAERQRAGFARALARLHPAEGLPSEAAAAAVLRVLDA